MDLFEGLSPSAWTTVHALGMLVACLTRLPFQQRVQTCLRCAMPIGLLAIGYSALSCGCFASLAWVGSGATLGAMVIAAVWEPRHSGHDPHLMRLISAHEPIPAAK